MSKELIEYTETDLAENFQKEDFADNCLREVDLIIENFEYDLSTDKARKSIASLGNKVAKLKTKLDGFGKGLIEEEKAKIDKVNASRKFLKDELDKRKRIALGPLTEWRAEQERIAAEIRGVFETIVKLSHVDFNDCYLGSDTVIEKINQLSSFEIDQELMSDQYEVAVSAKDSALSSLRTQLELMLAKEENEKLLAEKAEREKAEAERVRAEQEERQRIESEKAEAERIEKEAEAKIERDRVAAIRAEEERLAREAQIKKETEERLIREREAERKKVEAELEAKAKLVKEAEEREVRLAKEKAMKKENIERVNFSIVSALALIDIQESDAVRIIELINSGKIPVNIEY